MSLITFPKVREGMEFVGVRISSLLMISPQRAQRTQSAEVYFKNYKSAGASANPTPPARE
ncbi:MAG: hypothetical protein KJ714_08570 [Euryarchaeota archaeon]|nr:hypothetical protein [Euryarchaeota archaeon]